jgi:hypothetical protein
LVLAKKETIWRWSPRYVHTGKDFMIIVQFVQSSFAYDIILTFA